MTEPPTYTPISSTGTQPEYETFAAGVNETEGPSGLASLDGTNKPYRLPIVIELPKDF